MYPPRPHPPTPMNWKQLAIVGVVVFAMLLIVPRFGFWPLLFFFWLGLPILKNVLNSVGEASARARKSREAGQERDYRREQQNGRPYHAPSAYEFDEEKPKRRPEYVVGDDGELVELEPEEEKPKRQSYRDDFV